MGKENPKPRQSRPILCNPCDGTLNRVWVAEYMALHGVTMEVALEHAVHAMKNFAAGVKDTIAKLEMSDEETLNNIQCFQEKYKVVPGHYLQIPLVNMFERYEDN